MKKILLLLVTLSSNVYPEKKDTSITVTGEDVSWFMKQTQEYVIGPVFTSFVERKINEMDIGQLNRLLEKRINERMGEFIKVGQEAKQLVESKADKDLIKCKHEAMAAIFHTLRPAEITVRAMYPKMVTLFDQLNKQYPDQYTQLTYSLEEDTKTVQEVEKAIDKKPIETKQPEAEEKPKKEEPTSWFSWNK